MIYTCIVQCYTGPECIYYRQAQALQITYLLKVHLQRTYTKEVIECLGLHCVNKTGSHYTASSSWAGNAIPMTSSPTDYTI